MKNGYKNSSLTSSKLLSIVTPTYNRKKLLPNLYQSLQKQDCSLFEWIIIDDGSTDGTDTLVKTWISSTNTKTAIKYFKQVNSGKAAAINSGLDVASGKYFLVLDSDDVLVPNAVRKICGWMESIIDCSEICAVSPNMAEMTVDHEKIKDGAGQESFVGSFLDRYSTIHGERLFVFKTGIHRKYRYPILKGEKFITEAVAWNRMANDGYFVKFYQEPLCLYEYQNDGLTQQGFKLFLDNPKGYWLWVNELNEFYYHRNKLKILFSFINDFHNLYTVEQIHQITKANHCLIRIMIFLIKQINEKNEK